MKVHIYSRRKKRSTRLRTRIDLMGKKIPWWCTTLYNSHDPHLICRGRVDGGGKKRKPSSSRGGMDGLYQWRTQSSSTAWANLTTDNKFILYLTSWYLSASLDQENKKLTTSARHSKEPRHMPRLAGPWVHQCLPARCDLDAYLIISLAFYPCDVYAQPALQTNARCIVLTR